MPVLSRIIALSSNTRSARSAARAWRPIDLCHKNRMTCQLKLCFTIVVEVRRLLKKKKNCYKSNRFEKNLLLIVRFKIFWFNFTKNVFYLYCWKIETKCYSFYIQKLFLWCALLSRYKLAKMTVFLNVQKIFKRKVVKKSLKKNRCRLFLPKNTKKKSSE